MAQQPIQLGASISITGRDAVQGGYVREGYLLCQKHETKRVVSSDVQFSL